MAPRNVRNFFIEAEVDGRKTKAATGPASKDGGFRMTIYIRKDGAISNEAVVIRGDVIRETGALLLTAFQYIPDGERRTITLARGKR